MTTTTETVTATRGQRRRLRRLVALCVALALFAAACGDSDDGADSKDDAAADTSEGQAAGSTTCADSSTMFDLINNATYAIVGEARANDGGILPIFAGTAWAVSERLLVTNAHITEFFVEFAEAGVQFERTVAVHAGTGTVVELLRGITHPDYTGNPLFSPDVGLFTTKDVLPTRLTLAPARTDVAVGQEILLAGFPADVEEIYSIIPGQTVPQATSLSGEITARRSHDETQAVTVDNLDVLQHQAPTTPGTSGSSVVSCNSVIAVNNAGTTRLVAVPQPDGSFEVERQSPAANNFAVHVKYIHELLDLFEDNAVQGFGLPLDAVAQSGGGDGGGDGGEATGGPITLTGQVSDEGAQHQFEITIADDGSISGVSTWAETGQFQLTGALAGDGSLVFVDDAPERLGFRRGTYEGQINQDGTVTGIYYEETQENQTWSWSAGLS